MEPSVPATVLDLPVVLLLPARRCMPRPWVHKWSGRRGFRTLHGRCTLFVHLNSDRLGAWCKWEMNHDVDVGAIQRWEKGLD
jgi:hypothetical protein